MSKASVDLPEPDTPVITVNARAESRRRSTSGCARARCRCRIASGARRRPAAGAQSRVGGGSRYNGCRSVDARPLRRAARCAFSSRPVCERRCHHVVGRADRDDLTAGIAAFGAEVDDPVGSANDVEVVLDDHQRVPGGDQLAERAQQLGDVVEVQSGRRLVEQKQRAAACGGLRAAASARNPASFRRCASPPESVGTGCPSWR